MIEPLIRRCIMQSSQAELLATYDGKPAVFYQLAPHDKDEKWDTKLMYPRVDYYIDWSYNAERKTSGSLEVNVWCLGDDTLAPEDIASELVDEMSETFFNDGEDVVCIVWNSSNSFESGEKTEPRVYGVTISFDVLAFPKQIVPTKPDPVLAMNKYLKELLGDAYMLGYDELPDTFRTSDNKPAVYVRLASNKADMRTGGWAITWMDCSLNVHVIMPDPNTRELVLQQLMHRMTLDGECLVAATSPLLFEQLASNFGVNPLFDGQLNVTGRYGVLNYDKDWDAPILNVIHRKVVRG